MHRTVHLAVLQLAVLAVLAQAAFAVGASEEQNAESGTSGNIQWDITDGKLTLNLYGSSDPAPMAWQGTEKAPWYDHRSTYTSAQIDPKFTTLCDNLFLDSNYLSSVIIPGNVYYIGDNAFKNCSSLSSVTIPASVTGVGSQVFANCMNLRLITFPTTEWTLAAIGANAFDLLMDHSAMSIDCEVRSPNSIASGKLDTYKGPNTTFTYRDDSSYTVTFAVNDPQWGYVTSTSMNVFAGTAITYSGDVLNVGSQPCMAVAMPSSSQYSYRFDHWAGIPTGNKVVQDVTITACFERTVNTYTVSFGVDDPQCGTVGRSSISNVPYGSSVSVQDNRVTIGHEYAIAYPTESDQQYTYSFASWSGIPADMNVRGNLSVTACFDKVLNSYKVSFDAAGGSPVPADQDVTYGLTATKPADPSKTSAEFLGWYYNNQLWDFGTAVTKDIRLVAYWKDECTVTFDVQGHGTAPVSQTVEKGQRITEPTEPSEPGFFFGGWFREWSCTTAWNFDLDSVQEPMTLYAKWTAAECSISPDGQNWTFCETLEDALSRCSDGWSIRLVSPDVRSTFLIDKSVTVIFNGTTFLSPTTELIISANVTFSGMNQMPLTVTFSEGACLTTDVEFALTARFAEVESSAGKVFVRGLGTDDVAVAQQGYAAQQGTLGIVLTKVVDLPFAVFDGTVFVFYPTLKQAMANHPQQTYVYVLDYIPLYGSASTLTYTVDDSIDRDITLATVIRVTDGVHSSFYLGTEEIYNNGQSIPLPAGKDLVSKLEGRLYVSAGKILRIADVSVSQTVVLGGGKTGSGDLPVATVRLTQSAPATRIIIGFENLDSWVDKVETSEGWVYRLKQGCNYEFIFSEYLSLNNLIGIDASGFKADIDMTGFSARLAASSSIIAYIRTSETSFVGYTSLDEAIAQAADPYGMSIDRTVYILYRTPHKAGDQPTVSHDIDSNIIYDGSFRFDTVHQNVDQTGKTSTYTVDDSIATLVFAEGRGMTVTQDADLSKLYVDGVIRIEGKQTVDLGGDWGPDRTITMDLSAHEAGTIVKNTGSVQWKVTAYPGAGCSVWKVRQDLLLSVPLPEGKDYSLYVWIAVAASLGAVAVAGLYFLRVKSR